LKRGVLVESTFHTIIIFHNIWQNLMSCCRLKVGIESSFPVSPKMTSQTMKDNTSSTSEYLYGKEKEIYKSLNNIFNIFQISYICKDLSRLYTSHFYDRAWNWNAFDPLSIIPYGLLLFHLLSFNIDMEFCMVLRNEWFWRQLQIFVNIKDILKAFVKDLKELQGPQCSCNIPMYWEMIDLCFLMLW